GRPHAGHVADRRQARRAAVRLPQGGEGGPRRLPRAAQEVRLRGGFATADRRGGTEEGAAAPPLTMTGKVVKKMCKVRLTCCGSTFTISPEFCLFSVPAPPFKDASR